MTQTEWDCLPNAKHIDQVLASLKSHPKKWRTSSEAAKRDITWLEAWNAAWCSEDAVGRYNIWYTAWNAANAITYKATYDAAWYAAKGAILALIVYDDCGYMIESEVGELKIIAKLGDPRAILLLPACIIYNETKSTTPSKSYMDKIKCLFSI